MKGDEKLFCNWSVFPHFVLRTNVHLKEDLRDTCPYNFLYKSCHKTVASIYYTPN